MLKVVARRDSRVRVVASPGRGITAALNYGIALAAGRFIARQDADDVSLPERFERQVDCLDRRPQLCAVGTGTIAIDDAGRPLARLRVGSGPARVRKGLRRSSPMTPVHGSMMIRRECLAAVGGYREAFEACQDLDLWLRLVERYDIDNITDPLYRWRVTAGSVYGSRRKIHLLYGGIALAFAAERARSGADSYALLERAAGDLDGFAERYRLRGLLHALWGDLLLRGMPDTRLARRQFHLALRNRYVRPRTLLLWIWTSAGLPWIGGQPLRVPEPARGGSRGAGS